MNQDILPIMNHIRRFPIVDQLELISEISRTLCVRKKKKNLHDLISNEHVWTDEDIKAVEQGRTIINQWKIF